jgi:hypothetical protein
MPRPRQLPFDTLDAAFRLLTTGPRPLALDGRRVGHGLPARPIPLDELRSRLLHPSTSFAARDAAIAALLARAKAEGGAATIGLAVVLLPGLRHAASPLIRTCPRKRADLEAEMLAGLLEGIRAVRPDEDRVAGRLLRYGLFAGRRLVERLCIQGRRERPVWTSAEPPRPASHPDLVLFDAVAEGVLTVAEAELIGETRLGGVPLSELAARWGVGYEALKKRRQRAEARLVRWLRARMSPNGGQFGSFQ